jgi:hypothetical protein
MDRVWIVTLVLGLLLSVAQSILILSLFSVLGRLHAEQDPAMRPLVTEDGPNLHARLPPLQSNTVNGGYFFSEEMIGKRWLLFFASPGCEPCEILLQSMPSIARAYGRDEGLIFVVVWEGNLAEVPSSLYRSTSNTFVVHDPDGDLRESIGVLRTPFAFLIDQVGFVRMKGVINNRSQLNALVRQKGRPIGGLLWHPVS